MFVFLLWLTVGAVASVILGSFYEWLMHRYVMHRPLGPIRYPFEAHAVVHHHVFKADHTYHLIDEKDRETIPMAWWNGPVLIALFNLPTLIVSWATGIWPLLYGGLIAFTVYYAVYEYIHWCMHLPKSRRLEKSGIFFRLNGHHLLHHRYMHKNFNVVLPLADLCMGTLMRRSKIKFKQANGPAVPNVQPLSTPTSPSPEIAAEEELAPVMGVAGRVA